MEYELLSKIFYKKPTEYESIYDARFNSEASIKLPIKIHENVGFIFNTNEITKLLVKIYKTINKINLLRTRLPNIAINSYIIKSLQEKKLKMRLTQSKMIKALDLKDLWINILN